MDNGRLQIKRSTFHSLLDRTSYVTYVRARTIGQYPLTVYRMDTFHGDRRIELMYG